MRRYVGNFNLDAFDVAVGDQVVDIGCGEGPFDILLTKAGINVTGVEPESYLRKRFTKWAAHTGPGTATVVDGTAEKLPFADGTIRRIIITEVLEHVADPAISLREMYRVLEPGGVACISVPTSHTERIYWRLHPGYEKNSTHLRIFTKQQLLGDITAAGFTIRHVEGRNFAAALLWVGHALLRSNSDHAGVITQNLWLNRLSDRCWRVLRAIRLEGVFNRIGNKLFPKSWYVYCEKPR